MKNLRKIDSYNVLIMSSYTQIHHIYLNSKLEIIFTPVTFATRACAYDSNVTTNLGGQKMQMMQVVH